MQVVLVMFRSDGERRSFSVVRNMTVIGRREDCDLRIPVGDVSRKHCRLVRTDDGIRIEDLGSSNGTYVNGVRLQESDLQPGDIVGIGPVQFIVQIDGVPDESDMLPPTLPAAPSMDDEDSLIGQQIPQEQSISEGLLEQPPQDELQNEGDLAAAGSMADDVTVDEFPPVDEPVEPPLPLEQTAAKPTPPESADLELSPLELSPVEAAADEFALDEPVAESPEEEPIPLEDLHESASESEHTTMAAAPPALATSPEPDLDLLSDDEFELAEPETPLASQHATTAEPAEPELLEPIPLTGPAEDFEDLDFDKLELTEPETAPPVAASADLKVDELMPPVREEMEEVNLDGDANDLPATPQAKPIDAAAESDWDFVVEEADGAREGEDFKLDLDSPHQQHHGQA